MYNRYTPNSSGGYQRQSVPSPPPSRPPEPQHHMEPHVPPEPPCPPEPPRRPEPSRPQDPPHRPEPSRHSEPPCSQPRFQIPLLNRLIPTGMDTGDLLALLIFLLLLSEGNEDSSTVILTLAIFLFLQ